MVSRIARLGTAAGLQLLALVLAHQLVYLARYGSRFGEALVHAGHGDAWSVTVVSVVALALVVAAIGAARLIRLGVVVRRSTPGTLGRRGAASGGPLLRTALLRAWLRLAPRMAILTLILLSLQENIEQAAIGAPIAGPGILLSPEYAGAAWIALAVAAVISLVSALFEWRRSVLFARLRAATRACFSPGDDRVRRPSSRHRTPVESVLGRRSALRAPPAAVVPA
jgi:hypothetical protein